ncbi:hypothetical protein BCR32DRAFT_241069 [Anaeromyces robustus]|uniref:Uncharacterized protein n=1 Tax=Anaeromyces robustus TaxID=1754192 RepID=A0A1Y1XKY2_9FUNG|nr:hypothetical protein BCR32DRAFT_241069 [Anaeromyces robustus]|eukprot:ORX86353.1 hypothetical protein BCR32DRAFT_241069 [Anaeromyces robustus]
MNNYIDLTEELSKLNFDELIEEYIDRARSVLNRSVIKNQKTEQLMYNESITLDNFYEYRHRFIDDYDYLFLYDAFDYVIGGSIQYESIIYQILYTKVKDGIIYVIIFYLIGISLILFSIYYTYTLIKEINTTLRELINIIFIVPKSAIELAPEFKRFIENGYIDD